MAEVKNICLEALERHCADGARGRLDLRRGAYEGQIFTQDGFMVHAHLAGLEGVPALFRLFDWGDAETIWNSDVAAEHASLHLPLEDACILYAEHLQERAALESREKERLDNTFISPEAFAGQAGVIESVLKYYIISLDCTEPGVLPGGYSFSDTAKSSYVIGSAEDCDVVLRHPSVDLLHCGVILEKGSLFIWDLGSQSGVKLNGIPIAEDILKVGDVMTLGMLDLRVRFNLRRPKFNRPITVPLPQMPVPKQGSAAKGLPKGAITYDRASRSIKDAGGSKPFLTKIGSLFGAKKTK